MTDRKSQKFSRSADLPSIKKVADIQNPKSFVIYGLPGSGKTTLASTFPKPLLLMDMNDKGTDSISDVKNVYVAEIEDAAQVDAMYWELKEGRHDYETVVLDTMTRFQELVIEEVTGSKESLTFGSLSRKQFGDVSGRLKNLITLYRDLDMNVVFIAQQRVFNVAEDSDLPDDELPAEIGPALLPSVETHLSASVNVVSQAYIRNKRVETKEGSKIRRRDIQQHCLWVGPSATRRSKIRKPRSVVPPSYLVNPTYEDLMTIIEGED